MIEKFENPELLTREEIDEKYDGKYVAILDDDELFSKGLGYAIAIGEKTQDVFVRLFDYIDTMYDIYQMPGTVRAASSDREDDELYVVIRNVQ